MTADVVNMNCSEKVGKYRKDKGLIGIMLAQTIESNKGGNTCIKTVITARFYKPSNSTVYCCLWIHDGRQYASGAGKADGHGYHHGSTALENALIDAGIHLSESIDGGGDLGMSDALAAIMTALGHTYVHIEHERP